MFTGIVQCQGCIKNIINSEMLRSITIEAPAEALVGLKIGASVAIDGVCVTVTKIEASNFSFDIMQETLSLTTLGELKVGDWTNFERSASEGAEVGGHLLSGHVDGCAKIIKIEKPGDNYVVTFQVPLELTRYIFQKGFIALNGTSLTVTDLNKQDGTFKVWFIPETLRVTTFGEKKVGQRINIEIDRKTQIIVETVRDFLDEYVEQMAADVLHDQSLEASNN